MSDAQDLDHQLASAALGELFAQMIEHIAISLARPKLIAIIKMQQRHRCTSQRVDHVPIVDHMTVLPVAAGTPAHKTQHLCTADEQLHAIVKQVCPQPMPDYSRRYGVKY